METIGTVATLKGDLEAKVRHAYGQRAEASLLLLAHYGNDYAHAHAGEPQDVRDARRAREVDLQRLVGMCKAAAREAEAALAALYEGYEAKAREGAKAYTTQMAAIEALHARLTKGASA